MAVTVLTAALYIELLRSGADNLQRHAKQVNDLNVFPIPDGDTGDNMLLTISGGADADYDTDDLGTAAGQAAQSMLLSARGNSGVILSQLFSGLADGLNGCAQAGISDYVRAMQCGVDKAYKAVVNPTEGTILTVARETAEFAAVNSFSSFEELFRQCIEQAKLSLTRTPELLYVLKQAGVVDSGAAGLIYIMKGMYSCLSGEPVQALPVHTQGKAAVDVSLFTEDSVLEFGYCTELLIRLQNSKTDIAQFSLDGFRDTLSTLGDSIVLLKDGSIVKLHIHTMTPYKVLEAAQRYGEFLTVKIENMMLQHNEVVAVENTRAGERKKYAVVAAATGSGITETFTEFGADAVINGGQTMNPSSGDFIEAFNKVNADTIFVLPNNGNVILAAEQAAKLYKNSVVRVVPTKSIGDGYSVLSMLDMEGKSADEIFSDMNDAMADTITAEISCSIRDAEINGMQISKGQYIGIIGKDIVSADTDCVDTACRAIDKMNIQDHACVMIIRGKDGSPEHSAAVAAYIAEHYPLAEVYESYGGQEVYDFLLVAE